MIHLVFDLLAAALAFQALRLTHAWSPTPTEPPAFRPAYATALVLGAVLGAYGLGTANLWLSGLPGLGRSILGALIGATLAVEGYKALTGTKGSTGALFVPAFSLAVAVGRIGCFLSGLADNTHGIPTSLPWGHDFGDGIPRHPVQLYEAATMGGFFAVSLWLLARHPQAFRARGFYLMAGVYAAQRFGLEFLKPYAALWGPLNLFHFATAALFLYAALMLARSRHA